MHFTQFYIMLRNLLLMKRKLDLKCGIDSLFTSQTTFSRRGSYVQRWLMNSQSHRTTCKFAHNNSTKCNLTSMNLQFLLTGGTTMLNHAHMLHGHSEMMAEWSFKMASFIIEIGIFIYNCIKHVYNFVVELKAQNNYI